MIVSGVLIVWVQTNVSWALGFGVATACLALGFAGFVLATPTYKRRVPTGSPLRSLAQVVVAACRKLRLRVPLDASLLHEAIITTDKQVEKDQQVPRIAHTDEFAFLDKAAVVEDAMMGLSSSSSWRLCTVTQVEELKILLRLLPIWATSIVLSAAYAQLNTTFVQQGGAMDARVLSLHVPAASMHGLLRGALRAGLGARLRLPHRPGAEEERVVITRRAVAAAHGARDGRGGDGGDAAGRGESISIAWQMPQYFVLAGGEVFSYIAPLEFFYNEAPGAMKSTCTSLALLTVAMGSYMSSFVFAVDGRQGWIYDDLKAGHLDYFFWLMHGRAMHAQLRRLQRVRQELQGQDRRVVIRLCFLCLHCMLALGRSVEEDVVG
ncbi:hypothetical protein PR202_gb15540 [Eleusine coracana subsp. coracana]|uniref:Uncharacterized protein n=1 Tax=Eleusine coracana subsp. coracana TaxID=191504 RepID=A0AAV5EZD5_ELECO|nr:hypothetical protein PR202_gb15540 [Eleusine coracana subsp. coracana]